MGNTLGSYLYDEGETIPLAETERVSYTLARDVSFIKSQEDVYYSVCRDSWLTEKSIPSGTHLSVRRVFKTSEGRVKILAQFDQEPELLDVSAMFRAVSPLFPRGEYLAIHV
jgi:hypothetical protein